MQEMGGVMKINGNQVVSIRAINYHTGEACDIKDLYWFEENFVNWYHEEDWSFEITLTEGL